MSQQRLSGCHAAAARASLRHAGAYVVTTITHLLLRVISLAPFLYAMLSKQFLGVPQAHASAVALLCCIPLYLLLVLPFRFQVGARVSRWLGAGFRAGRYSTWFQRGIIWILHTLPWLLPLLLYMGGYHYVMNTDANIMFSLFTGTGAIIGGDFLHGILMLAALFVICVVLAAWGWHRNMPRFYLPANKKIRPTTARVTAINLLITLVPLLIVAVILSASVASRLTGDMRMDALTLLSATDFDFPPRDLWTVAAVLVVLYLPFILWRKTALASAVHQQIRS
jgi:hypothetical protein